MSLHHLAKQVAAKGRDEDKMLVHMTPREVAGLQQLAMAHGGSLTINPHTGLPEAGFLKSILPMIAGAVATFFTGGAAAPWMAALAGGATGAITGDKNQSLLMRAGLGALGGWGGGSLAAGLTKAGATNLATNTAKTAADQGVKAAANTAATNAAATAAKTGAQALLPGGLTGTVANPLANTAAQASTQAGTQLAKSSLASATKQGVGKTLATNALSKVPTGWAGVKAAGTGLTKLATEKGRDAIAQGMFMQSPKLGLAAAAIPTAIAANTPTPLKNSKEPLPEYQMYTYNPGTVNPKFGEPGEPYFIGQGYSTPRTTNQNPFSPSYSSYDKQGKGVGTPGISPLEQYMQEMRGQQQPPVAAAEGGALSDYIAGMNEGKQTSDPMSMSLNDYMANMNQQRAASSSPMQYRPPNMTMNGGMGYNVYNMEPGMRGAGSGGGGGMMGAMAGMRSATFAEGGLASLGGYSDGGRLLRGPGDGVSDDIPATIHRDDGTKQEARLADGEFVFPARIVSEIGNGSTEAGAQKLYAVMDKIQRDRAGTLKDVAKDTNAIRHVEALA